MQMNYYKLIIHPLQQLKTTDMLSTQLPLSINVKTHKLSKQTHNPFTLLAGVALVGDCIRTFVPFGFLVITRGKYPSSSSALSGILNAT
jgi:hypothetical protein